MYSDTLATQSTIHKPYYFPLLRFQYALSSLYSMHFETFQTLECTSLNKIKTLLQTTGSYQLIKD